MLIEEIKSDLTPFQIFQIFKNENQIVFLDSGENYEKLGKYSIIAFNPFLKIKSKNRETIIESLDKKEVYGNPFNILKKFFLKFKKDYKSDLPFIGGMLGCFSYDLKNYIEKLPQTVKDDVLIPDMDIGIYDGAIVFCHKSKQIYITDSEVNENAKDRMKYISEKIEKKEFEELNIKKHNQRPNFNINMTKDEYLNSIYKIKEYIREGDIYQVNMTQRFDTELRDEPLELYSKLRDINSAPFGAYLDFGDYQILSSSPERFVELRGSKLQTRPIKGTRPRGETEKEDEILKKELLSSEKDRAELLMIVDLERNDFSKIAKTGTVKVPKLFLVEKYPTVFHLVATVTSEVDEKYNSIDIIEATFPGGSITGAPKIRAMEIIDELEPTTRNIYTGSIGYIDFNGNMDLNIVIRTMIVKENKVYFQVGGGIVWDSDAEAEYQESLDKAKALIEALSL